MVNKVFPDRSWHVLRKINKRIRNYSLSMGLELSPKHLIFALSSATVVFIALLLLNTSAIYQLSPVIFYRIDHPDTAVSNGIKYLYRKEMEHQHKETLRTVKELFDSLKITYFLDFSSLLAAFRADSYQTSRDTISDRVGILPQALNDLQNKNYYVPREYEFFVFATKKRPQGARDRSVVARLIHSKSGLHVDIIEFVPYIRDERQTMLKSMWSMCWAECHHCRTRDTDGRRQLEVPYEWVFPVKECHLHGIQMYCPNRSNLLLMYEHGQQILN